MMTVEQRLFRHSFFAMRTILLFDTQNQRLSANQMRSGRFWPTNENHRFLYIFARQMQEACTRSIVLIFWSRVLHTWLSIRRNEQHGECARIFLMCTAYAECARRDATLSHVQLSQFVAAFIWLFFIFVFAVRICVAILFIILDVRDCFIINSSNIGNPSGAASVIGRKYISACMRVWVSAHRRWCGMRSTIWYFCHSNGGQTVFNWNIWCCWHSDPTRMSSVYLFMSTTNFRKCQSTMWTI